MPNNKVKVFLSYAHDNLDVVSQVDEGLRKRNLDVCFDKRCLGPGSWKKQIEKTIPKCRYFLICISDAALKKTGDDPGFQDEELQQAYELARLQSEDHFSIVPARIEECGRGDHRLSSWQQYDLFENFEDSLDKLAIDLGGLSLRDREIEDSRTENEKFIQQSYSILLCWRFQ